MSSFDDGNSSTKTSSSEDSEIKLLKVNELRNDAGLPPLLSRRQALRNARSAQTTNFEAMEVLDYGSADDSNAKVDLSVTDSSDDEERQDVIHGQRAGKAPMEGCDEAVFDMNTCATMEVDSTLVVECVDFPVVERSAAYVANENTAGKLDDLFRLASHYAKGPREEAIRERAKNMELKEFILSKGFTMQNVNDQLGQSDQLRLRQVDDFGFFVAARSNHLNDLQRSFTVDKGILTLEKERTTRPDPVQTGRMQNESASNHTLALPWNEVVKKSRNYAAGEGPSNRVSALDPRRLMIKDITGSSVVNPLLSFKPTSSPAGTSDSKCVAIAPPLNFLQSARKMWDSSLVAYFASASLTFERTRAALFKLWGPMGLKKVYYNSKGFYTLKFNMVSEMETVLKLGSVNIDKRKLFLRPWMEGTQFQKNQLTSVPIWVKFVNVPHSYWSVEGLSYIASAIGVPISLDSPTSNPEPMKFARICVNLKFDSTRPKEILVPVLSDEDGSMIMDRVQVEYPTLPPNCSHCNCFGHSLSKCTAYRSHMDTMQRANLNLVHDENSARNSNVRRLGKEIMVENATVQVHGNDITTPVMINFQQADSSLARNNNISATKVAPQNATVVTKINDLIDISPLAQTNVTPMQNSTMTVTDKGLGSMVVQTTVNTAKDQVNIQESRAAGPFTIEIFDAANTVQGQTPNPKPKRKKRAAKNKSSKGMICPNLNEKAMAESSEEKTEGNLNLQLQLQNLKGGIKEPHSAMAGNSSASAMGFTRVTRRTASKMPALEGYPATRY